MDASTTIEIETADASHNFFIKREYTYGEITIAFLLILLVGIKFWEVLLQIIKKDL